MKRQSNFKVFRRDEGVFLNFTVTPYNTVINSFNEDNLIFVQYTGCLDSFGKPIYEGDVIEIDNGDELHRSVVHFRDGAFVADLRFCVSNFTPIGWLVSDWQVRVIGNIHTNPALIEKPVSDVAIVPPHSLPTYEVGEMVRVSGASIRVKTPELTGKIVAKEDDICELEIYTVRFDQFQGFTERVTAYSIVGKAVSAQANV